MDFLRRLSNALGALTISPQEIAASRKKGSRIIHRARTCMAVARTRRMQRFAAKDCQHPPESSQIIWCDGTHFTVIRFALHFPGQVQVGSSAEKHADVSRSGIGPKCQVPEVFSKVTRAIPQSFTNLYPLPSQVRSARPFFRKESEVTDGEPNERTLRGRQS